MDQFIKEFHVDFAVILSVLTLLTGVIWLLNKLFLAPRRKARSIDPEGQKPGHIVEFSVSFFPVIFAVLILRSFIAEPFRIPSGSMIPTLLVGDFILVNKFAYGIRSPIGHWKWVDTGAPQRGDVAVFRYPVDPSKDFIKRIVGMPGDRISYRNKRLYINGDLIQVERKGEFSVASRGRTFTVRRYEEALGDVKHDILINPIAMSRSGEFVVPEGEYFAMGDNRDGSDDSRSWGTVEERHLVGKAFFIWMSWDADINRPNWSRIGTPIK